MSGSKAKFEFQRVQGSPVGDAELIADVQAVAQQLGASTVPMREYERLGKYAYSTLHRRFGSWNKALLAAGLLTSNEIEISDERLFENILILWQRHGRQPRRSELANPPSVISQSPYNRRFGSWSAALKAFVDYANGSIAELPGAKLGTTALSKRLTARDPSIRLRWRVLQRDHFRCTTCGASPATDLGIELHVDHVVPWSKDGETTFENLATLCSKCNLGKSNLSAL